MKITLMKSVITATILTFAAVPVMASAAHSLPQIESEAAVVLDAHTGIVLFERRKDEQVFPASVTKVMTALLAIENSDGEFDERVPFSYEAVHSIMPGSSHIAMDEGETLSLDDALYALMLASANEVSNAVAEFVSGDMPSFARQMNARAAGLGAVNTNFTNAHGLPEDNHYTTAYDSALIMREAVQHPKFIELISTQTYEIMPTERQAEIRLLNNSNRMILPHTRFYDERVVGGKTGFTNAARHTLATFANVGDIELIVVTMRGEARDPYRDTSVLLDYGFEQFEEIEVLDPTRFEEPVPVVQIMDGTAEELGTVMVKASGENGAPATITRLLPKQAARYVTVETSLPSRAIAPVNVGDVLGELRIYCNKTLLETIPLVAVESIEMREIIPAPVLPVASEPANSIPLMWALLSGLVVLSLLALSVMLALRR